MKVINIFPVDNWWKMWISLKKSQKIERCRHKYGFYGNISKKIKNARCTSLSG